MSGYHTRDDGTSDRCRAKKFENCPFGGEENHYESKREAIEGYEQKQSLIASINDTPKRDPNELTSHALKSSLSFKGPRPQWLTEKDSIAEALNLAKPEIIDTITIDERTYAVVYEPDSIEPTTVPVQLARGCRINAITYRDLESGETLGYIRALWLDEKSLERSFGSDDLTAQRYAISEEGVRVRGSLFQTIAEIDNYLVNQRAHPLDQENLSAEEALEIKRDLWAKLHKKAEIAPESFDRSQLPSLWLDNLTAEHAPDDPQKLDADLSNINKHYEERMRNKLDSERQAHVDFSRLNEGAQGKGIAPSLYVYLAKALAWENNSLAASSNQSDQARALWQNLLKQEGLPLTVASRVTKNRFERKITHHYALDFRESTEDSQAPVSAFGSLRK